MYKRILTVVDGSRSGERIVSWVRLLARECGAEIHLLMTGEAVSHLAHALQCAGLARERRASDEVVLAALLHDIGHLVSGGEESPQSHHGTWGARYIARRVPARVAQLVEHHVVAKRYLCTVDRSYAESLSPVSLRSWLVQGGRLDPATRRDVELQPWLPDALRIRAWDDLAKDPRAAPSPLESYRDLLESCFGRQSWEGRVDADVG